MTSTALWHVVGATADCTTAASFAVVGWTAVSAGARTRRPRTRAFTGGVAAVAVALAGGYVVHGLLARPPTWQACWAVATAGLVTWFAAERRVWLRALLIHTPAAHERRQRAMEAHDEVVQALVVASYALDVGEHRRARDAMDSALHASRGALSDALDGRADDEALVRRASAAYVGAGSAPGDVAPYPSGNVVPASRRAL